MVTGGISLFWNCVSNASSIATLSSEARSVAKLHDDRKIRERFEEIGRQIDWESVSKDMEFQMGAVDSYISSKHEQISEGIIFSDEEVSKFIEDFYLKNSNCIAYKDNIDPILHKYLLELENFLAEQMSTGERLIYRKIQKFVKCGPAFYIDSQDKNRPNSDERFNVEYITEIPSGLCMKYISREKMIMVLEETMQQQKHINLFSIGGLGKTELTKEFLNKLYFENESTSHIEKIAWIQYIAGDFVQSLKQAFHKDIEWMDFQKLCEKCRDRLLVVIDDIEIIDDDYLNKLAELPCYILITSRVRYIANFTTIELQALTNEEQQLLFYSLYSGEHQDVTLNKILELACCHTITISFLARVAQYNDWNLEELYKRLTAKGFRLSRIEIDSSHHKLKTEASIIKQLAILFDIISCSDAEKYVLTCSSVMPNLSYSVSQACDWIREDCGGILYKLYKIGLLESSRKAGVLVYWMHSVIASAIRYQQQDQLYQITRPLIGKLSNEIDTGTEWGYEYKKMYLIPFCWAIYDLLERDISENEDATFLMRLCYLALEANNLSLGYRLAMQSYNVDKKNEEWEAVVRDLIALGDAETRAWHPTEAIKHYLNAKSYLEERVINKDSDFYQELSAIYHNLANVYQQLDDFDDALKYAFLSKDVQDTHDLSNKREQSTCLSDIAMIYLALGDTEKADDFIDNAIKALDHLDLANSEDIMLYQYKADILYEMGDSEGALQYFEIVKNFREQHYDEYNTNLADFYTDYSLCLCYAGKYEQAEEYSKKAVRTYLYNDGKYSTRYLKGCNTYALILSTEGKREEACEEYEKIFDLNKEKKILTDNDILIFSTNYIEALISKDFVTDSDLNNALLLNKKAEEIYENTKNEHPQIKQNILENYADIYWQQKDPKAIEYYEFLCSHCLDEEVRIHFKLRIIDCCLDQSDFEKAEKNVYEILDFIQDKEEYLFEKAYCYGCLSCIKEDEEGEEYFSQMLQLIENLDDENKELIRENFLY